MVTTVISIESSCRWNMAGKQLTPHSRDDWGNIPDMDVLRAAFQSYMPFPPSLELNFHSVLRHLLGHPGSMVRPRLVYQIATAYGIKHETALDLAVALEYFHTASLVFDDLPCMDNALTRRGAECAHRVCGEAEAILGALALINRAYALTWKAIATCPAHIQPRAMEYVELRLGVHGLLNGQSFDLNYASLPHDRATTERIATGKTVSLIRLTLVLPAMLGGASPRELQLFERIASCWGMGYQMLDDLKDVLHSTEETGKTSEQDQSLDRPNIVLAIGISAAIQRLTRHIHAGDRALAALLTEQPALQFLSGLRDGLRYELDRILQKVREATGDGAR